MSDRQATVLFADVSDSTKLYETAGDAAAHDAVSRCLEIMRKATEGSGGRVVKTVGDEILALFPEPDGAVSAAAEIQARTEALPPVADTKLGVRIGFHCGPVLQKDDDIFGDTVNVAARLVAQATKGQILTTAETAEQLGPVYKTLTRALYGITVRGKSDEIALAEILWRSDGDTTVLVGSRPRAPEKKTLLRLKFRDQEIIRRRDNDSLEIGRDAGNGLVIDDEMASRQHCTIEKRLERVVLKDHSTNGTYVTIEGDAELHLRREELVLRKHGWISFGEPRAATQVVVEFFID
jgi:adenylate cyclase